jgi:hypothetical protein
VPLRCIPKTNKQFTLLLESAAATFSFISKFCSLFFRAKKIRYLSPISVQLP